MSEDSPSLLEMGISNEILGPDDTLEPQKRGILTEKKIVEPSPIICKIVGQKVVSFDTRDSSLVVGERSKNGVYYKRLLNPKNEEDQLIAEVIRAQLDQAEVFDIKNPIHKELIKSKPPENDEIAKLNVETKNHEQVFSNPETGQVMAKIPEVAGAAGTVGEFPPGMYEAELVRYVRDRIRFLEARPNIIEPDTIESYGNRIDEYVGPDPNNPIDEERKIKLQVELEARLNLAAANYWLVAGDAGKYSEFLSGLNAERLNMIRDEVLKVGGLRAIQRMEELGPNGDPGWYFRRPDQGIVDATTLGDMVLVDHISMQEASEKLRMVKALFDVTGMSTFYQGPVDSDPTSPTFGKLLEPMFMGQAIEVGLTATNDYTLPNSAKIPLVTGTVITPNNLNAETMLIYQRNEQYWEIKRQYRLKMRDRKDSANPNRDNGTKIEFATRSGGQALLKRIFYAPEEYDDRVYRNERTGKAKSLFASMELYVVPMPFMLGVAGTNHALTDYIGYLNAAPNDFSEKRVQKNRAFRFGMIVKGAADAFNKGIEFLNEPVKGGESAGSLENLGSNLSNMGEFMKSLSYLQGYAPNVLSYAVSTALIETMQYIDDVKRKFKDRWREFRNIPRFGPQTKSAIINAELFNQLWDQQWRVETLASVNASVGQITRTKSLQAGQKTGMDVLGALFKAISRK